MKQGVLKFLPIGDPQIDQFQNLRSSDICYHNNHDQIDSDFGKRKKMMMMMTKFSRKSGNSKVWIKPTAPNSAAFGTVT